MNNLTVNNSQVIISKNKDSFKRTFFISVSRVTRALLFFAYATLPMWSTWLAGHLGLRNSVPTDMLVAMAWLPISGAIIALSFMKFGWKQKIKGTLSFIIYNAVSIGCIVTWLKYI